MNPPPPPPNPPPYRLPRLVSRPPTPVSQPSPTQENVVEKRQLPAPNPARIELQIRICRRIRIYRMDDLQSSCARCLIYYVYSKLLRKELQLALERGKEFPGFSGGGLPVCSIIGDIKFKMISNLDIDVPSVYVEQNNKLVQIQKLYYLDSQFPTSLEDRMRSILEKVEDLRCVVLYEFYSRNFPNVYWRKKKLEHLKMRLGITEANELERIEELKIKAVEACHHLSRELKDCPYFFFTGERYCPSSVDALLIGIALLIFFAFEKTSTLYREFMKFSNLRGYVEKFFTIFMKENTEIFDFSEQLKALNWTSDQLLQHLGKVMHLGTGIYGKVYLCSIPKDNQMNLPSGEHAVKIATHVGQIWVEKDKLKALRYDRVIQMIGYGFSENVCCLVLKYYRGGDLDKKLEGDAEISMQFALDVLCDVAYGLHLVHTDPFNLQAHGDLTAKNILLDDVRGRRRAVLADFGSSLTEGVEGLEEKVKHPDNTKYCSRKYDIYYLGFLISRFLFTHKLVTLPHLAIVNKTSEDRELRPALKGSKVQVEMMIQLSQDCMRESRLARPAAYDVVDRLNAIVGLS